MKLKYFFGDSKFLEKILRVNKIAMENFLKKSTLNFRCLH